MIIAVWFSIITLIFLVGMGLVVLTFRHWYLESKRQGLAKGKNLEDSGTAQQITP